MDDLDLKEEITEDIRNGADKGSTYEKFKDGFALTNEELADYIGQLIPKRKILRLAVCKWILVFLLSINILSKIFMLFQSYQYYTIYILQIFIIAGFIYLIFLINKFNTTAYNITIGIFGIAFLNSLFNTKFEPDFYLNFINLIEFMLITIISLFVRSQLNAGYSIIEQPERVGDGVYEQSKKIVFND